MQAYTSCPDGEGGGEKNHSSMNSNKITTEMRALASFKLTLPLQKHNTFYTNVHSMLTSVLKQPLFFFLKQIMQTVDVQSDTTK